MAPHCEMAAHAVAAQQTEQSRVAVDEEQKDQGKSDQDRAGLLCDLQDGVRILLDVDHPYGVTVLAQHRGKVAETEVSLILEANQHDRPRRVALAAGLSLALEHADRNRLVHHSFRAKIVSAPAGPVPDDLVDLFAEGGLLLSDF